MCVAHCYSTGAVTGYKNVGGLVGLNSGTAAQCYSTGTVSGDDNIGGLVGYGWSQSRVTGSFWDTQTSDQASGAGGTGKPTREMRDPNTFMAAGWDFVNESDGPSDIWAEPAGGGYPILWWQLSPLPELPTFSGGNGEPNAPYLITTADELNSIGYNPRLLGSHFKLIADVDSGGSLFYPVGSEVYPYRGVFDGNGRTVSNLTCDCNGVDYVGLFGCVSDPNAQIKDLRLLNPRIDAGTGDYVGVLVGHLKDGTITGCYVEGGRVAGDKLVGGLVGVHGEAGRSQSRPTISNCWSTGIVEGTVSVGGLVGENYGAVTATGNTGTVIGNKGPVGGLVGVNCGSITTSCSTGSVSTMGSSAGGLAG